MEKIIVSPRQDGDPPLYKMVVRALQSEIVSGIYPVGTQLPSEAALRERFGISRHTVREALRALKDVGLVESRQGLGTVVISPGADQTYVHQINQISDLFDVNVETQYQPVDGKLLSLPSGVAQRLGIPDEKSWLQIKALRFAPGDEQPMCETDVYVASRFAGVGRLMTRHKGSIYRLVETIYGESIEEVRQEVRAFKARKGENISIGMSEGDVGVVIERVFRISSDNEIAIVSFNRYRADKFSLSLTLKRTRS
jgi:GntR family transcriptional regulator